MGELELRISLQREGEARVRAFWQDAEAVVAEQRAAHDAELEELRAELHLRRGREEARLRNSLISAARSRAQTCRLRAEAVLEKRLLELARQQLPDLAGEDRGALWQALRSELPAAAWTAVTVYPAEREVAQRDFQGAVITCDETLGGGMVVACDEGAVRIDNSLHCRLQRAWPDLLPRLMAELRKEVDDETADADITG